MLTPLENEIAFILLKLSNILDVFDIDDYFDKMVEQISILLCCYTEVQLPI